MTELHAQQLNLVISSELAGQRLDKALSSLPEIESRSRASALITSGQVTLNSKLVKASQITRAGEIYNIVIPRRPDSTLQPLNLELDIYFEDEALIVLNKPAGLVVHPAAGHYADTLVNALLHYSPQLSKGSSPSRPGIVHRLDKDTSGLLVVAKTDSAHRHLAQQFKERSIHRVYWAVVYGRPVRGRGIIETYLRRHPTDRKRFASEPLVAGREPTGKRALTHYQYVSSSGPALSLLHCRLETGRTHQIRVHLSELGHPILGDRIYGGDRRTKSIQAKTLRDQVAELSRIALHAAELGFVHPVSKEQMKFECPWPEDLKFLAQEFSK